MPGEAGLKRARAARQLRPVEAVADLGADLEPGELAPEAGAGGPLEVHRVEVVGAARDVGAVEEHVGTEREAAKRDQLTAQLDAGLDQAGAADDGGGDHPGAAGDGGGARPGVIASGALGADPRREVALGEAALTGGAAGVVALGDRDVAGGGAEDRADPGARGDDDAGDRDVAAD